MAFSAAAIAAAAMAALPSAAVSGLGALATGLGATTIGTGLTSLGATIGGLGASAGTAMGVSAPVISFATSLGTGLGNVIAPLAEGIGGFLTGGGVGELGGGLLQSGANVLGEFGLAEGAANTLAPLVTNTSALGPIVPAGGATVANAVSPLVTALEAVPGAAAGGTPVVGGSTGSVGGALQAASVVSSAATAATPPAGNPPPPPPPPLTPIDKPEMTMDRPGMTMAAVDIPSLSQAATSPLGSPLGGRTAMSARPPMPGLPKPEIRSGPFEPPSKPHSPLGRTSFIQPNPFKGAIPTLQERLWQERQRRNGGSW